MVVYDSQNDTLKETQNDKEVYLNALIQELKLFKGENPLDVDKGIDYLGIFRGEVFMQIEVEEVLDRHRKNFGELTAGTPEVDGDTVYMPLQITFLDGETVSTNIVVGG